MSGLTKSHRSVAVGSPGQDQEAKREQMVLVARELNRINALPPEERDVCVHLNGQPETRKSLAARDFIKNQRCSVVIYQPVGLDYSLQHDALLGAFESPAEVPALTGSEAVIEQPASLQKQLANCFLMLVHFFRRPHARKPAKQSRWGEA